MNNKNKYYFDDYNDENSKIIDFEKNNDDWDDEEEIEYGKTDLKIMENIKTNNNITNNYAINNNDSNDIEDESFGTDRTNSESEHSSDKNISVNKTKDKIDKEFDDISFNNDSFHNNKNISNKSLSMKSKSKSKESLFNDKNINNKFEFAKTKEVGSNISLSKKNNKLIVVNNEPFNDKELEEDIKQRKIRELKEKLARRKLELEENVKEEEPKPVINITNNNKPKVIKFEENKEPEKKQKVVKFEEPKKEDIKEPVSNNNNNINRFNISKANNKINLENNEKIQNYKLKLLEQNRKLIEAQSKPKEIESKKEDIIPKEIKYEEKKVSFEKPKEDIIKIKEKDNNIEVKKPIIEPIPNNNDDVKEPPKKIKKESPPKKIPSDLDSDSEDQELITYYKSVAKYEELNLNNKLEFALHPHHNDNIIQMTIYRDKKGLKNKFFPKYHLYFLKYKEKRLGNGRISHELIEKIHILSAKKKAINKSSNYYISTDTKDFNKSNKNCFAKLRANFVGTKFTLYDSKDNPFKFKNLSRDKARCELGAINYERNIFGVNGPRKMMMIFPEYTDGSYKIIQPINRTERIKEKIKTNNLDGLNIYLNNPPIWNEDYKAFVLDFHGRVMAPSVKNFQLIRKEDLGKEDPKIYLQFGKVSDHEFNIDFRFPFSPLQAFAIALSSCDNKLFCE